jgi:hypothetical protein
MLIMQLRIKEQRRERRRNRLARNGEAAEVVDDDDDVDVIGDIEVGAGKSIGMKALAGMGLGNQHHYARFTNDEAYVGEDAAL